MMIEVFRESFILQEIAHGVMAVPFAILLYYKTKSLPRAVAVIICTYLVDLDHSMDYLLYHGFDISWEKIMDADYFWKTGRAIIPLHAWEWTIILGIISYIKGWKSLFVIALFALIPQLIVDSFSVGTAIGYSIIYRGINGRLI